MSLFSIFSKKHPLDVTSAASVEEALAGGAARSSNKARSRKSDKEDPDIEIPEKKRARRRLIGAVVMVLAVTIGVPMIFDSEPKPLNKNIAIQVASVDEPTDPEEELLQTETVEEDVPTRSSTAPSSVATTLEPAPAKPSFPSTISVTKHKEETGKKASEDSARALAILNGMDPSTSSQNTMRIVVQVGAFATQAKVNQVRSKLNAAGIKSYTQKVATSSGDKIRVRVGPFDNKEAAEKIKAQLKKIGIDASVITL